MTDTSIDKSWLLPDRSNHAELPVWDEETQILCFVDMEPNPSVHQVTGGLDSATYTRFEFSDQELAGGVFFRQGSSKDQIYVGSKLGWGSARLDAKTSQVADYQELVNVRSVTMAKSEASWKPIRLNEATTDLRGRIWFATCCEGESDIKPALYLFDPSQRLLLQVACSPAELTMPNAMCFSRDHFYLGCSIAGKIWRWTVDLDAVDPANMLQDGELFLQVQKPQVPDGATTDQDGNLYVAIFNGGCVQVYSPEAQLLRTIRLPAQSPTCPVFAGSKLDQLMVTTHAVKDEMRQEVVEAGQAASKEELQRRWPEDKGGIYRIALEGTRGTVKHRAL